MLEEIGAGGFATTYLAQQLETDRHVVVKIPHSFLLKGDTADEVRVRFANEMHAASRVTHRNLAAVYTAGETADGVPVMVMEYVPGVNLECQLLARAPFSAGALSDLGVQLASALAAIHSAGIIHRDLTPRNVLCSADERGTRRYVLVDFGIAKMAQSESNTLGTLGTPRYMPPEQIQGNPVPHSDMFGLGAILWWAVTGQEYLAGLPSNAYSMMMHQLDSERPTDPRTLVPYLPAPLAEMIARLLHHDPDERPSPEAFCRCWPAIAADIDRLASSRPIALQQAGAVAASVPPNIARADGRSYRMAVGSQSEICDPNANTSLQFPVPTNPDTLVTGHHEFDRTERFLGTMPELLVALDNATSPPRSAELLDVCVQMAASARTVGAEQLVRYAEIVAQLTREGLIVEATEFASELSAECQRAMRAVLNEHRERG
ncbi:MAG: serine/threonine-protein kinase [Myxococcota bacterium]